MERAEIEARADVTVRRSATEARQRKPEIARDEASAQIAAEGEAGASSLRGG